MATFLLIRHGLTDAVGQYYAGRAEGVPLNDVGRGDVERLVQRLDGVTLARIISSPLQRTRETAELLAHPRGLTVEIDEAFNEFAVGDWTGLPFAALHQLTAWQGFNVSRSLVRPPGGELMLDVQQRSVSALLRLAAEPDRGPIAIVTHGDVIRAMLMYVLGVPFDFVHRLDVDPARISIVDVSPTAARVRQLNGDSVPPAL